MKIISTSSQNDRNQSQKNYISTSHNPLQSHPCEFHPSLYQFYLITPHKSKYSIFWLSRKDKSIQNQVVQFSLSFPPLKAWNDWDILSSQKSTEHWMFSQEQHNYKKIWVQFNYEKVWVDSLMAYPALFNQVCHHDDGI